MLIPALVFPHQAHLTEDIVKRLTFIISYCTTPEELEDSILSILENRPDSCEIFVIKNKTYENPYDLSEDEVHFVEAPQEFMLPKDPNWECFRQGIDLCDSDYVYLMPSGIRFQADWPNAVTILEQNPDLGAFFLDENLNLGGFFRKTLLKDLVESQIKNTSAKEILPAASEIECLNSLATLLQENGWVCGLAEFEESDDTNAAAFPTHAESERTGSAQNTPRQSDPGASASVTPLCSLQESEESTEISSITSQHLSHEEPPLRKSAHAAEFVSADSPETASLVNSEKGIVKRFRSLCRKLFTRSLKSESENFDS